MCARDQVAASEVVFIGDSFIALGNNIPNALDANARAAGSLAQNESYRRNAVSGALLGNGQIPIQYMNAVGASPVKVVLMNGGGNDCFQNNPNPAYSAAMSLFQNMAQRNTEHVRLFLLSRSARKFRDWNAQALPRRAATDDEEPLRRLAAPKCHFIDLRPGWNSTHTSDGIHTTAAAGSSSRI